MSNGIPGEQLHQIEFPLIAVASSTQKGFVVHFHFDAAYNAITSEPVTVLFVRHPFAGGVHGTNTFATMVHQILAANTFLVRDCRRCFWLLLSDHGRRRIHITDHDLFYRHSFGVTKHDKEICYFALINKSHFSPFSKSALFADSHSFEPINHDKADTTSVIHS